MNRTVTIGPHFVGDGQPCFVVAEIGINHNGSIDTAKQLIAAAADAGCDAVKFQKRTIELVYTADELAKPRENPFGPTNGDLKRGLEFDRSAYEEIGRHCRANDILWFSSCWDSASVDFMEAFDPPCYKIASALLTDDDLLRRHRACGRPIILSTGMSTLEQIEHAIDVLGTDNLILMHCTSTYPANPNELNLRVIETLRHRWDVPIGYSGHEVGLAPSIAAVSLGACMLERHITLDRAMWGSDQAASIEPGGFERMVRYIRAVEEAMGDGIKQVWPSEVPVMQKLRRVGL